MIVRKSAFDKTESKAQAVFMSAISKLNKKGEYVKFINWHANMGGYRMHAMGFDAKVGMLRFLAWHRIYLLEFEKALRRVEPTAYIPYWKWVDGGVPKWIETFKPTVGGVTRLKSSHMDPNPTFHPPQTINVNRINLTSAITTQKKIDAILAQPDFASFSTALERGPHNNGHNLLGHQMRTEISPTDPMFWMHHANVDRIWALWQKKNPSLKPVIDAVHTTDPAKKKQFAAKWSVLQPFGVHIDKASRKTNDMGYSYA